MEHKMFVYFITNNIDNKFYIGQTINLDTRLKRHLYLLKRGLHHSKYFQNFYNKHRHSIQLTIKAIFSSENQELIDFIEEELIEKYYGKNLLNVSKKARGGDIISTLPNYEEYCKKQSYLVSERMKDPTQRLKHSRPGVNNFNYKHGDFVRVDKVCSCCGKTLPKRLTKSTDLCSSCLASTRTEDKNPFYGKTHTEEARSSISKKNKANSEKRKLNNELERGSIPVFVEGVLYRSYSDAARALNLDTVHLVKFRVKSSNWDYRSYYSYDSPKKYEDLKISKTNWYISTPEQECILFKDHPLDENILRSRLNSKNFPDYVWVGPPQEIEPEYQICAILKYIYNNVE